MLSAGSTLQLDLREYFELGERGPGGKFAGYPTVVPFVKDTLVVAIAYDPQVDRHGEGFGVLAKTTGESRVSLDISWNGSGAVGETARQMKNFTVKVSPY